MFINRGATKSMRYTPDIHHRRSIRLKYFDYSSAGMYYVTICTQDRAKLFGEIVRATLCNHSDNADKMIVKWLKEIENKFLGIHIDRFIVMPNHIHFIVCIQGGCTGPSLHEIVEWFKTMTTNEYIRGVKSGLYPPFNKRIWQRNYFERIIRNDSEYQRISQYIEDNPTRWVENE
jgi:REP element-mobilizing transposase RayT